MKPKRSRGLGADIDRISFVACSGSAPAVALDLRIGGRYRGFVRDRHRLRRGTLPGIQRGTLPGIRRETLPGIQREFRCQFCALSLHASLDGCDLHPEHFAPDFLIGRADFALRLWRSGGFLI